MSINGSRCHIWVELLSCQQNRGGLFPAIWELRGTSDSHWSTTIQGLHTQYMMFKSVAAAVASVMVVAAEMVATPPPGNLSPFQSCNYTHSFLAATPVPRYWQCEFPAVGRPSHWTALSSLTRIGASLNWTGNTICEPPYSCTAYNTYVCLSSHNLFCD